MAELRELINKQRDGSKKNHVYWVGEQILDICADHPHYAEVVKQDLNGGAKIADVEKKIAAFAKANGGCTPPKEAERIIFDFFGLEKISSEKEGVIDLADFL